jgi:hypothetical protein
MPHLVTRGTNLRWAEDTSVEHGILARKDHFHKALALGAPSWLSKSKNRGNFTRQSADIILDVIRESSFGMVKTADLAQNRRINSRNITRRRDGNCSQLG